METPQKINVLDVGISQVKINDILELIPKFIKTDNKGYVTVTGAHGIIESRRDERIRSIHNNSYMSIPDGMPCVWVSKLKKSKILSISCLNELPWGNPKNFTKFGEL